MFSRPLPAVDEDERKDLFGPVADLMVGVVFIFIILLLALTLNMVADAGVPLQQYQQAVHDKEQALEDSRRLKAEIGRLESELHRERARAEELTEFARFVRDSKVVPLMDRLSRADQARSRMLDDMRAQLARAGVDVTIDPANGTLRLPSGRLFDSGSDTPTPFGRQTLQKLAGVLGQTMSCYVGGAGLAPGSDASGCPARPEFSSLSAVYVEGHTDVIPFSNPSARLRNNWDLSAARAIEAFQLLRTAEPRLGELRSNEGEALLGVSGYAETRPAQTGTPDRRDGPIREQDRRIELRVTMTTDRQAVGAVLQDLNQRLERIDAHLR